ncbi:MAG: HEPN domain-containing protein [Candidatus Hydrogenedentes bacterium]|nr:HEPN domain-containing protein [Candidatus Hydrogenedentota bacterium]
MDTEKHVEYWRKGAEEEWEVAEDLFRAKRYRHALFFGHLAIEKNREGIVTRETGQVPPKTHNLLRLLDLSGLQGTQEQKATMRRLNMYQLEGRYPGEISGAELGREQASELMEETRRVLEWLKTPC